MTPRLLLTSPVRPYPLMPGGFSPFDQMGFRFTRGQGIFTMQEHTHFYGLHLLAQNVGCPARVLEFPAMEDLEEELRQGGYEVLGITTNVFNLETVALMCERVRRLSPGTRIVVGGYGTLCLTEESHRLLRVGTEVDAICTGDGVPFLRALLGTGEPGPIEGRLPLCGSGLPWLNPRLPGSSGTILSGLGCTTRCPFCATSAQYGGRYRSFLDAADVFRLMKGYWRSCDSVNFVALLDENFLNQPEKFEELGRLIREDSEHGLSRLNYLMFASAQHVARRDPDELLLNGVDGIWIGVESRFSPLAKRQGIDMQALFDRLHRHGINTVGSMIAGFDFQTPENIDDDFEHYLALSPTLQQIGILNTLPGTEQWRQMRAEDRLVNVRRPSAQNIYGETVRHRHFTHDELLARVDLAYRRSHERNGPAVLRFLELTLNGYEHCLGSANPLLSEQKSQLFARRATLYGPLAAVVTEHAPSPSVRERARETHARFRRLFPDAAAQSRAAERFLLKRAEAEAVRLEREGPRLREEPFRVYTYSGRGGLKPYDVEHPPTRGAGRFFA